MVKIKRYLQSGLELPYIKSPIGLKTELSFKTRQSTSKYQNEPRILILLFLNYNQVLLYLDVPIWAGESA
jgi:hypothetical protein